MKKKKFYCDYGQSFLSDPFIGMFKGLDGKEITAKIGGASVYITGIPINRSTGQPMYSEGEEREDHWGEYFGATINENLGVLVYLRDNHYPLERVLPKDMILAGRITAYTIEIEESPFVFRSIEVEEKEFIRIIKENFDKFNIPDNYHGQSTSYGTHVIEREYKRESYRVGYDKNNKPIIEEAAIYPSAIVHFFSSTTSLSKAQTYKEALEKMTPDEMWQMIMDTNKKTANAMFEIIKKHEESKENI